MSNITIERLAESKKEDYEAVKRLLKQLSKSGHITEEEFENILSCEHSRLYVARDGGKIVGFGMLIVMNILVERRGRFEDMVVDEDYRGHGIGKQLLKFILDAARELGLEAIEFSSRPSREAANSFYKKMGFEQKETNVYRMEL